MELFKKKPCAWVLSWNARLGKYSNDRKRVSKILLDKKEAIAYKKSLEQAKRLLQDTDDIEIDLERQS